MKEYHREKAIKEISGTTWSKYEIDFLKDQNKKNVSAPVIAKMLNRSVKAVNVKLYKIRRENRSPADNGSQSLKDVIKKDDLVADMLAPKPLNKKPKNSKRKKVRNYKYTREENQIVLRMLGRFTIEEIAERLDVLGDMNGRKEKRSTRSVYAKIHRIYAEASHTLAASLDFSEEYKAVGVVRDSAYERMKPQTIITRKKLLAELTPGMVSLFGTDYEKSDDKPDDKPDEHWQNQKVNPINERHVELKTWHKPRINLSEKKQETLSLKPRDIVPEPMVQVTSTEMNELLKAVEGLKPTEEPKKKGFFRRLFSG